MSEASFARQYLNEPVSEEQKFFKSRYLKDSLERGRSKSLLPRWDNSNPDPLYSDMYGHLIVGIGLDLAISKKTTSDYTGIAVWGLNEHRDRVLLYLDYGRWSPQETISKVLELFHAFHPAKIRVENVAFQDMLRQELANEDIPVEGFHTTGPRKYDEETGIMHLATLAEQGRMIIPGAKTNKDYYERVRRLLYEMSVYSPDTHAGDLLMASWFACGVLSEFDKQIAENRGFFSTNSLVEQRKSLRASQRVVLLGYNPPFFKLSHQSVVYVYRPVEAESIFIEPEEKFMIVTTREQRSCGYIFNKSTSEIVAKLEGDLTALNWTSLLERAGYFFNKAQLVIDRNGEGDGIYQELMRRNYPKLLVKQPDEDGHMIMKEGVYINESTLPIATDYFKQAFDGLHIKIPDDLLLQEMSELIKVEGNKLVSSYGTGQRIKTVAYGFWLLDKYETDEKTMYNGKKKKNIRKKELRVPYLVFKNKYGRDRERE